MRKYIAALAVILAVCIGVLPALADGSAPVAENFEFETPRGVSFGAQLAAADPEGDALTFEITTQPTKGTIELEDDGKFVYTPEDGRRGRDYFGYRAVDQNGNRSQEATVIIKLTKNKSVYYADMDGSASYCSAVRLAECGAFIGKQIGGEYYFEPEACVTRGEFLTMCLNAMNADILSGVVSTGFSDDAGIPEWQKAYIASAVKDGIVKGRPSESGACFDSDTEISRVEAGVILDRMLRLTNVSADSGSSELPVWAAQSAANVDACGILPLESIDGTALTRAQAADMIAAAMDVSARRG